MDPQSLGVDYCGPYVSGGKFQSSVCSTHTARSSEEQCCKDHDCCYVHAGSSSDFASCDQSFVGCNAPLDSFQSSLNSYLVDTFGSYFHSNKMTGLKRRHSYDAFDTSAGTSVRFADDTPIHDGFTYHAPRTWYEAVYTPDRPSVRRVPLAPGRSRKRLRLDPKIRREITTNLTTAFNNADPFLRAKRRRFSRLPRFYRRRIARQAQRSWRIAYAKKKRLAWRNNYYRRRVSSASRIQRSFRKFLWRKKLRANSFRRIRFLSSPRRGLRRYYKY